MDVKVNVSAAAGNALVLKDDGLYVPTPEEVDISGKADKATGATTGNVNIDGKEVVVYTEPENVLHDEDVEDFSAEEIAALLADAD